MRNIIKSSSYTRLLALMAGAMLFGLASQGALALTVAGTDITNTAKLDYTVGGISQTQLTGTATFKVDVKVNLTVVNGTAANVTPAATNVNSTKFTITNLGNATQGYTLTAAQTATTTAGATATDSFDTGALSIYLNTGCDGTTVGAALVGGVIPSNVAANGGTVCVFVQAATIPSVNAALAAMSNTDASVITLKAQTTWPGTLVPAEEPAGAVANATVVANTGAADTSGIDVVLAEPLTASPADAAYDGAYTAYGAYKIVTSALTVSKTAAVFCDPITGLAAANAKSIPGAMIQYTITVTNGAGGADANLTTITDALQVADLTIDPGTTAAGLTVPTNAATCVIGAGTGGYKVTVPVARLLGGSAGGSAAVSYFTTTTADADGIDYGITTAGTTTADFTKILPNNGGTYATDGLLKANDSVTIIYNAFVK